MTGGLSTPPALNLCGRCICHRQRSLAGHIGPNPSQAGLFDESPQAARARRATISRPYGTPSVTAPLAAAFGGNLAGP